MNLAVISSAPIVIKGDTKNLYAPYLNEMKVWSKHVDYITFCCPIWKHENNLLVSDLEKSKIEYNIIEIPDFDITTGFGILRTIFFLPIIFFRIVQTMNNADHIHLRCPGNVGLLGCIAQIFFPSKKKTAKYAGNWDPKAKQPCSYRLQKWILNNTFLTHNMQVLVYGEWEGMSKNINPFFTATYTDNEAQKALSLPPKYLPSKTPIQFMYVGTLTANKRPLYALALFKKLLEEHIDAELHLYGEGNQRQEILDFCSLNKIENKVILHGNQPKEVVEQAYQNAHFLFLASQSEGWPKVVAEAMFWGCVPLSTNVSCVHQMMGFGERGLLLNLESENDIKNIIEIIENRSRFAEMSEKGKQWSTSYTLDTFETEIGKLVDPLKN